MRNVGVHEGAVSRTNLLVAVIAVAVQTVDTLIICIPSPFVLSGLSCILYILHLRVTLCATSVELTHRGHSDKKAEVIS